VNLKGEPVAVGAVVIAIVGIGSALGLPNGLAAAVTGLVTAVVGLFARSQVMPVTKAVTAVTEAATAAATGVAESLDETTVGIVGTVTAPAASLVNGIVAGATSTVLRAAGISRKTQAEGEGLALPE
jgi:hypothetical protein